MSRWENGVTSQLETRWLAGNYEAWPALKVYVDKRVTESLGRHFDKMDPARANYYKRSVPDIHNVLLDKDAIDPRSMESFASYCSRLTRMIAVEISKLEAERNQAGIEEKSC